MAHRKALPLVEEFEGEVSALLRQFDPEILKKQKLNIKDTSVKSRIKDEIGVTAGKLKIILLGKVAHAPEQSQLLLYKTFMVILNNSLQKVKTNLKLDISRETKFFHKQRTDEEWQQLMQNDLLELANMFNPGEKKKIDHDTEVSTISRAASSISVRGSSAGPTANPSPAAVSVSVSSSPTITSPITRSPTTSSSTTSST